MNAARRRFAGLAMALALLAACDEAGQPASVPHGTPPTTPTPGAPPLPGPATR